ncbi:PEPxxWA-CTERM sorting domain-containing protein [Sandaracinobacteroides saxicola]|uniref:PEP-CTERM sorting domain-containing protein n=1 Tax=Sandaracinobacteroides saxicola TaxID=2759707 RepID=A0A7G5IDP9_9SPHN|nr:PEPxxWA-CTERM sorting domain-containing protein [Sandaracinobacteroides saxicola]QMW21491.1 PEP-CTERM sorting domain-containing protein [Sandaracinobacteroides saxicola]
MFKVLAATVGLAFAATSALADVCSPDVTISYNITSLDYPVDNVIHFNISPCGAGRGGTLSFGTGSTGFGLWYGEPQTNLFLMGTAQDLPGDPEGQKHIVIFGSTGWAASAQDIAFGTLFPTFLEGQLIAALEDAATGNGSEASYQLIDDFWFNAALPGGVTFGPNDRFTAVAFSQGQVIGQGFAVQTPVSAIPEPATWAMLIAGFGMVGVAARRRFPAAQR